jgi:hypothetical protein
VPQAASLWPLECNVLPSKLSCWHALWIYFI